MCCLFGILDYGGKLSRKEKTKILSILSARGVNMTKLESIPVPGRDFEFQFYLDLDANIHAPGVTAMLSDLEKHVESFTFLGNYPVV